MIKKTKLIVVRPYERVVEYGYIEDGELKNKCKIFTMMNFKRCSVLLEKILLNAQLKNIEVDRCWVCQVGETDEHLLFACEDKPS